MRRFLFSLALVLALTASPVLAQTPTLIWNHPSTTVAQANAMQTQVVADGTIVTAAQTCTQVGTSAECRVAIPQITNGQHVYRVNSNIAGVNHEAQLNLTWPPSGGNGQGPTAPRLTITVVVSVP
jgi:hypothetical protein